MSIRREIDIRDIELTRYDLIMGSRLWFATSLPPMISLIK